MKAVHRWIPEERICLARYESSINVAEIVEADGKLFENHQGPNIRFLFDLRDSDLDLSPDDVKEYYRWLDGLGLETSHPGIKQAILAETPHQTAIVMFFNQLAAEDLTLEVFSTVDAACDYLGIPRELLREHADLIPR